MSQSDVPFSTMITFVLRFWRERTDGGLRLRGRIEHVQSGTGTTFQDLEGMLRFTRQFEVDICGESTTEVQNGLSGKS